MTTIKKTTAEIGDNVRVHDPEDPFDAELVGPGSDGLVVVAPHDSDEPESVRAELVEPAKNYEKRVDLAEGLRKLADLFESTPNLPMPYGMEVASYLWEKDEFVEGAKLLPRPVEKDFSDAAAKVRVKLSKWVSFELSADRQKVCERRVVGTEKRTVERPDPSYSPPVIREEIEEEIVEWDCHPLLKIDPSEVEDGEVSPAGAFQAPIAGESQSAD